MIFRPLDIYEEVFFTKARYIDLWGGRGRGGSYFASQYLIFKITQPEYFRGFISRAIYRDIESSIWLELLDRIEENEDLDISNFKIKYYSKITYIPTGHSITSKGFNSGSSGRTANLKGFAGATHIVIDEAEEITEPQQNQLDDTFRTTKAQIQIFRVFNPPPKNHFIIKNDYNIFPVEVFDNNGKEIEGYFEAEQKGNSNHLSIFATYLDNYDNINETTKIKFENYKINNPEYYYSQIKGLISGGAKGIIFKFQKNWFLYENLPDIDFYVTFGLDFGGAGGMQTDEPDGHSKTTFGKLHINKASMSVYFKLLIYKGYISPSDLAIECKRHTIDENGKKMILADNARQDKIQDLLNEGLNVIGAKTKEGGSNRIVTGYDILKKYKIFVLKNDEITQTELNNHKWATNKATKEPTGQPEDKYKDILDLIRYALVNYDLYNW